MDSCCCVQISAYLVTVTPEVVLGADVLVGVFGLLGLRGHVGLVLPVLEPQAVGVDTTEDDRRDDDAVLRNSWSELFDCFFVPWVVVEGWGLYRSVGGQWVIGVSESCILDGELAPEVCGRMSQRFPRPIDMRSAASSS